MLHYDRGTQYTSALYRSTLRKNEELPDSTVVEVIVKLVSNPKFAAMMQEKINMKVDTSVIEQEIAAHEKQLRQSYSTKTRLMEEIDSLDPDDKHYIKRKADLDDRLYKMYDKIEDAESLLIAARAKKQAIEAEKLTGIRVESDEDAAKAADVLHAKGIGTVMITLGSRGVWLSAEAESRRIPGFRVQAIDTIAAGDTFNGALVTALLEGKRMDDAIRFAHAAAAIAVTRKGAQPSVPWRKEIDEFLSQQG